MNTLPPKLALFTYDFAHSKTFDFLTRLFLSGVSTCVIAAPRKKLVAPRRTVELNALRVTGSSWDLGSLCARYGFELVKSAHDDTDRIKSCIGRAGADQVGLIAGARILPKATIELFSQGIINLHPGKLPETAGLDSFYWTINHDCPLGTTVHFINEQVDAGRHLFFLQQPLSATDTVEKVFYERHANQLDALDKLLNMLKSGGLPQTKPIFRQRKNQVASDQQRLAAIKSFPNWLEKHRQPSTGDSCATD